MVLLAAFSDGESAEGKLGDKWVKVAGGRQKSVVHGPSRPLPVVSCELPSEGDEPRTKDCDS